MSSCRGTGSQPTRTSLKPHSGTQATLTLLEQNDEYQLQHRYMQIEGMAALATPTIEEAQPLQITPKAA